jgi:hypothetical protein
MTAETTFDNLHKCAGFCDKKAVLAGFWQVFQMCYNLNEFFL